MKPLVVPVVPDGGGVTDELAKIFSGDFSRRAGEFPGKTKREREGEAAGDGGGGRGARNRTFGGDDTS